jgi:hypothetical protein
MTMYGGCAAPPPHLPSDESEKDPRVPSKPSQPISAAAVTGIRSEFRVLRHTWMSDKIVLWMIGANYGN